MMSLHPNGHLSNLELLKLFLRLNMSMILNNATYVTKSPIWNTLILSRPKLPNNIDDSNDNEMKKIMMMIMTMMMKMMIYH